METVACDFCGKKFTRKKSQLRLVAKHYCSVQCRYEARKSGRIIVCMTCGKKAYKQPAELADPKGGKSFCCRQCANIWLGSQRLGIRHSNWKGGQFVYRNIMKRSSIDRSCNLCSEKDFRVLVVHHIDENRKNNRLDNLAWLCRNCHFSVHHYEDDRERFNEIIKNNAIHFL
jgi:5-methylcytosine-specific restriction endonuclease McrA